MNELITIIIAALIGGLVIWVVARLNLGLEVDGFVAAFIAAIVIAVIAAWSTGCWGLWASLSQAAG